MYHCPPASPENSGQPFSLEPWSNGINLVSIPTTASFQVILLTERTSQVDEFASRLTGLVKYIVVLKGGMGAKQRRAIAERLTAIPEGEERVLLATGRYIGEGFDDARLDTLFLAMPVSWCGTLQQYVGRLHRLHDSKREVIVYDYVDGCLPVFSAMYSKRVRGYEAVGYVVQDE